MLYELFKMLCDVRGTGAPQDRYALPGLPTPRCGGLRQIVVSSLRSTRDRAPRYGLVRYLLPSQATDQADADLS